MSEPISADHRQELCDVCRQPLVWPEGSTVSECRHSVKLDMSEPMRDEVALPELERGSCPIHGHEICACVEWEGFYAPLCQRERQLKAAPAANREKDAEIARLEGKLASTEYGGYSSRIRALEAELASLRASGGEKWIEIKPDTKLNDQMEVGRWIRKDKWTITRMEGEAEGWEYTQPNDFFTHYRMLAPPTLTREKE